MGGIFSSGEAVEAIGMSYPLLEQTINGVVLLMVGDSQKNHFAQVVSLKNLVWNKHFYMLFF